MRSLDRLPHKTTDSDTHKRLGDWPENQSIPMRIRIALFERIGERLRCESSGFRALNRFHLAPLSVQGIEMATKTKQVTVFMRPKIGRIPREDYYAERQKRWVWVFPKIDRHSSLNQIVDLDIFCSILFPHSIKKQGVAKAIIQILVEEKRPMYLRDLHFRVLEKIKVSAQTLSDTYKAMLRSGLLEKKYRNDPTRLSVQFSNRLRDLASYWDNYLSAKQIA